MADIKTTEEIRNKKVLAVEGEDDVGFFIKLVDYLNISGVYVVGLGGKNLFNVDLPKLKKRPGFRDLTHFAVVRDRNSDDAVESISKILKEKMGFENVPAESGQFISGTPKIGIFIMPGNNVEGSMLEDLCLKTVESHPVMKCVNEFAECISDLKLPPKDLSKRKCQAFLAAQPEIANTIGLGAQKKCWDFDAPVLDELKRFLESLR